MILRNDSAQKTILPFPVALRAKSVATISLRGAESLLGRIVREAIEPSRVDRQKLTSHPVRDLSFRTAQQFDHIRGAAEGIVIILTSSNHLVLTLTPAARMASAERDSLP